jgi:hypothetical protein
VQYIFYPRVFVLKWEKIGSSGILIQAFLP